MREIADRQCEHMVGGVRCPDSHERVLTIAGRRVWLCGAHWSAERESMLRRHMEARAECMEECRCGDVRPPYVETTDDGVLVGCVNPHCLAQTPICRYKSTAVVAWNAMVRAAKEG